MKSLALSSGRATVIGIAGAVGAAVATGYAVTVAAGSDHLNFAAAIAVLCGSAVAVLIRLARREDLFSPLGLVALFYLVAIVGGGLYYWREAGQGGGVVAGAYFRKDLATAVALATAGWLFFLVGYQANLLRSVGRLVPDLSRVLRPGPGWGGLLALLAVGWGARLVSVIEGRYFHVSLPGEEIAATESSTLVGLVDGLPLLAVAVIGAQAALRRPLPRSKRRLVLFWMLLLVELGWSVPTGERAAIVAVVFVPLVVGYYGRTRRSGFGVAAVAACGFVIFIFPLLDEYRNVSGFYQRDVTGSLSSAVHTVTERDVEDAVEAQFDAVFTRFSDVTAIAAIVYGGREGIGRSQGQTLLWSIEALVPRALYPSKEDPSLFGHEFGAKYGFTDPGARTAIAISQVGELYLSFGLIGVLAGSLFVGSAYRLLGEFLRGRRSDPSTLALAAVVAWPIIHAQEMILAVGFAGLLKQIVVYAIAMRLTTRRGPMRWRRPQAEEPQRGALALGSVNR